VRFDPDQYHRRSIWLPEYDYSQPGAYFVTMCTHGHACILGHVVEDGVQLSPYGEMVRQAWASLPRRFAAIELDEFVVMPNHVHGIIVITSIDVGAMHVGAVHVGAVHAQPHRSLVGNCPYNHGNNAGGCCCLPCSGTLR